jgi:hypothetical protein
MNHLFNKISGFAAFCVVVMAAAAIAISPSAEDAVALVVALLCAAFGVVLLSWLGKTRDGANMVRLFATAFVLRAAFTYLAFKTGIAASLGSADDLAWEVSWVESQEWAYWWGDPLGAPGNSNFPSHFLEVYFGTAARNSGYLFISGVFFRLIDVPSPLALAFLNSFMNAMTVVVIYKIAREFYSEKASLFAAGAAAFLPGFLAWSALTIKETWVIFFEISTFYTVWKFGRERRPLYAILTVLLIILTQGMRFYVAYTLSAAAIITLICMRSKQPFRTAVYSLLGLVAAFAVLSTAGVLSINIGSIVASQLEDINKFRTDVAGKQGGTSSIQIDADPTSPLGFLKLILIGGTYLLFSPFPWQAEGRQMLALPDVLLWWALVLFFIVPGMRHALKNQPNVFISLIAFVFPLILFYSMIFGNFGLAYRQRAQLMPFLLIFAAAGYDKRFGTAVQSAQRFGQAPKEEVERILREILIVLRRQGPLPALPASSTTAETSPYPNSPGTDVK